MFDIVTIEPEDEVVKSAINLIINGKGHPIPSPGGNYRYIAVDAVHMQGNGGASCEILCIVGHADADDLSGEKTWKNYVQAVSAGSTDWKSNKTSVYLVACSTAGTDGTKFLHGNIANEIKSSFPGAKVWASSTDVGVTDSGFTGEWQKL